MIIIFFKFLRVCEFEKLQITRTMGSVYYSSDSKYSFERILAI